MAVTAESLYEAVAQALGMLRGEILHGIGYETRFRAEATVIKPELRLVGANNAGNVVGDVDLTLQVVARCCSHMPTALSVTSNTYSSRRALSCL